MRSCFSTELSVVPLLVAVMFVVWFSFVKMLPVSPVFLSFLSSAGVIFVVHTARRILFGGSVRASGFADEFHVWPDRKSTTRNSRA